MNLYNHYKNKPYKYIGVAKHSETLEDVVVYECRYDNPSGKLWVRPKGMFEETVEVNGKTISRFAKIPLEVKTYSEVSESQIAIIEKLVKDSFGEWDADGFLSRLENKNLHLLIATVEGEPAAFKLGYEIDKSHFYSWLGAVSPKFRDVGIASDLMIEQHRWCQAQGYTSVRTTTQNRFKDMLILNLQHGFEVIGTHLSHDRDALKITLEKHF